MNKTLDIAANRRASKYTLKELLARVAWAFGRHLFRYSPRPCFGFRRYLLRLFGGKVGRQVHIYPSSIVYYPWNLEIGDDSAVGEDVLIYNLAPVVIGHRATISHRAHLCGGSHDYTDPKMALLKLPIHIGDDSWVCADAFVSGGVTVGEGAVVGARAVVTKDVEAWTIVAGNPAKGIRNRHLCQDLP